MVERMIESMLRPYRRRTPIRPIFPISPLFLTFCGSPQAAVWELVAPNLFIQRMTACAGNSCTLRPSYLGGKRAMMLCSFALLKPARMPQLSLPHVYGIGPPMEYMAL